MGCAGVGGHRSPVSISQRDYVNLKTHTGDYTTPLWPHINCPPTGGGINSGCAVWISVCVSIRRSSPHVRMASVVVTAARRMFSHVVQVVAGASVRVGVMVVSMRVMMSSSTTSSTGVVGVIVVSMVVSTTGMTSSTTTTVVVLRRCRRSLVVVVLVHLVAGRGGHVPHPRNHKLLRRKVVLRLHGQRAEAAVGVVFAFASAAMIIAGQRRFRLHRER